MSQSTFQQPERSSVDFRSARLPKKRAMLSLGMRESVDDYNPLEHREPKPVIPVWLAYVNLVRTGLGAGLLGFPLAISQTGMGLGTCMAVFSGILIIHMHLVLLKNLNEICRRLKIPTISYRYGFRIALLHGPPILQCLGRRGPCIISTFMLMSQLGICTVFIDFTADNLRDIMDLQGNRTAMLYLFLPFLVLEFLMKTLKVVSYVALLGNALSVLGLALVFYHIFLEPQGEFIHAAIEPLPVAFCFGTFMFNLSAVAVVLSIDKAIAKPKIMYRSFLGVVSIGMSVPLFISIVFGVLGYWSFGTMEENVLRSLPHEDITTIIAASLYTTAIALAFPLQCYPAIEILIEIIKNHDPYEEPTEEFLKVAEIIARPSFVIVTFLTAYLFPVQAPFVAFVGNLCTTMLALVFPALMEICLMYPGPYGPRNIYLIKNVLVAILGLVAWLFGAVICGHLIYIRIASSWSPNDDEYFK